MKFDNVTESYNEKLIKYSTDKNEFKMNSVSLTSYIRFEEADWSSRDIDVEIYHEKDKHGEDHIKDRFLDRQHNDVIRFKDFMVDQEDYDIFKWPKDYIKKLHKALKKIDRLYRLENKAYVLVSLEQSMVYMVVIGQYREDGEFNLDRKIAMVNTLYSIEMENVALKGFRHKGKLWDYKKLNIEEIRKVLNTSKLLKEFNIPSYEFIPIIEV